ncbi:hypothetical protein [Saccharopolyspora spinosa]|uniref:hypothetical protein n=1 Tax=Saccharopolyspora spinosa TaxID=60894 RepID=UPI001179D679|nr:hypothetical protein [Saccharopolyspora spinosa]
MTPMMRRAPVTRRRRVTANSPAEVEMAAALPYRSAAELSLISPELGDAPFLGDLLLVGSRHHES